VTIIEQLETRQTALNTKDLAAILQIDKRTLYDWAKTGKLPCLPVNGLIRFDPKEIADFLRKKRP
jgi:predicted site-specific integrase-resolvase